MVTVEELQEEIRSLKRDVIDTNMAIAREIRSRNYELVDNHRMYLRYLQQRIAGLEYRINPQANPGDRW